MSRLYPPEPSSGTTTPPIRRSYVRQALRDQFRRDRASDTSSSSISSKLLPYIPTTRSCVLDHSGHPAFHLRPNLPTSKYLPRQAFSLTAPYLHLPLIHHDVTGEIDDVSSDDDDLSDDVSRRRPSPEPELSSRVYRRACNQLGIVPASFFSRRLQSKELIMKRHLLGPTGAKACAIALVVSHIGFVKAILPTFFPVFWANPIPYYTISVTCDYISLKTGASST